MYGVNHHLSDDDGYEAVACGFTICRIPLSHSVQRTGLVRADLLIFNIATSNSHMSSITIMIIFINIIINHSHQHHRALSFKRWNTHSLVGCTIVQLYILLGTSLRITSLAMKKHVESFKKSGGIKDHAKHEEHLKIIKSFKIMCISYIAHFKQYVVDCN